MTQLAADAVTTEPFSITLPPNCGGVTLTSDVALSAHTSSMSSMIYCMASSFKTLTMSSGWEYIRISHITSPVTMTHAVHRSHCQTLSLSWSTHPTNIMVAPLSPVFDSFHTVMTPASPQTCRLLVHIYVRCALNMCIAREAIFPLTLIMTKPSSWVCISSATFPCMASGTRAPPSLHALYLPDMGKLAWTGCCAVVCLVEWTQSQVVVVQPNHYSTHALPSCGSHLLGPIIRIELV